MCDVRLTGHHVIVTYLLTAMCTWEVYQQLANWACLKIGQRKMHVLMVIKNALVSDNKLCFLESIVYYPHAKWDAHPSTPLWTLMFRDVQGACTNLGVVQCEHGERLDIGQGTHKAKAGWSGDHEVKDCGVVSSSFLVHGHCLVSQNLEASTVSSNGSLHFFSLKLP